MRGMTAAVAVAGLLACGCGGDSPTSAPTTQMFTGVVSAQQGGSADVTLSHTGNLRVTLSDVEPVLLDVTTFDPANLSFVLGIGNRAASGCTVTYSAAFVEGGVLSFGVDKGNYCLTITDTTLPEDSTVAYALRVEVTQ